MMRVAKPYIVSSTYRRQVRKRVAWVAAVLFISIVVLILNNPSEMPTQKQVVAAKSSSDTTHGSAKPSLPPTTSRQASSTGNGSTEGGSTAYAISLVPLKVSASESAQSVRHIPKNTALAVLTPDQNGFYKVRLADGVEGFIWKDHLTFVSNDARASTQPVSPPNRSAPAPSPQPKEDDTRPPESSLRTTAPLPVSGTWEGRLSKNNLKDGSQSITIAVPVQSGVEFTGRLVSSSPSSHINAERAIRGSWNALTGEVFFEEEVDVGETWQNAVRGTFVGTLSTDGRTLSGHWQSFSKQWTGTWSAKKK